MNLNKVVFRFVSISFSILVILLVLIGFVKIGTYCYDFGYRVFTEAPVDAEPGRDVIVQISDDMSDMDIAKELKEKALASIPVKAGGGYQFIYTKDQGGIVYVYPDKYGEKYKEGTFTRSSLAVGNSSYRKYEIKLDGMERTYIVQRYYPSKTRSVAMVPYGFYEDLLDQFTDDYPEVESVYTMQVVSAVF